MKLFLYPMNRTDSTINKNPYQELFIENIENNDITVINKNKSLKLGVISLLTHLIKTDVYYFNFIENIPERKFGVVQSLLFFPIFLILKLFNKKIVWMLHNKISHSKKYLPFKVLITYMMINYSDLVFTMSKDGISFGKTLLRRDRDLLFLHHPIENNLDRSNKLIEQNIDILIWGAVSPYKGVYEFLKFVKRNKLDETYKICLAGKVTKNSLLESIRKLNIKNISIIDSFISDDELELLHDRSKYILFTYAGYSTLSSAALMYSLSQGSRIIGPNVGSFRDLRKKSLIYTYEDFEEIEKIVASSKFDLSKDKIRDFIILNSWNRFTLTISDEIKRLT